FYDEDGIAYQTEEEVVDAHIYPCPTLSEVSGCVGELVGYCLTRWHTPSEVIAALQCHDPVAVLAEFRRRIQPPTNPAMIEVVFGLCAKQLGARLRSSFGSTGPSTPMLPFRGWHSPRRSASHFTRVMPRSPRHFHVWATKLGARACMCSVGLVPLSPWIGS